MDEKKKKAQLSKSSENKGWKKERLQTGCCLAVWILQAPQVEVHCFHTFIVVKFRTYMYGGSTWFSAMIIVPGTSHTGKNTETPHHGLFIS
jgi:hypothetical protein